MDFMKKALYLGIGAITLTKEKAEKLINDLVEKGEMNRDEAKQFVDEMLKKGEEEKKELRTIINNEINNVKNETGIITRTDLEKLEKRIAEIESKLN
ncbi:hypothetical protein SYNTR_0974 [Candidatus Syntrophocurvum alkaliphilum]|uniref:Polyhydroxyalkanoate synthesis regulator phasin n=1 Tax=Candidatus Syntrophocurvum alkaliphilum TaxID=2293317 RepID=A0A6I6DEH9_9FIRM|nr:polyhydroxyalkanoate synthesis regulator [Candidatus Syntrophocurvum alkaliphilum]QGT99567.1 hypothetical protein SYNTR_0974 [Candidatus Syntrophocurvum alkaliphilum]